MDIIFTKEFIAVAICFLIVICTVTCTMVLEINRKLNLIEEIKSMLKKKGF